ncbi:MAG: hypothetical protein J7639_10815 [Paenibacillaceae bacterium]|nr:hypothetical protein [Paenibacillaceae bacterium]
MALISKFDPSDPDHIFGLTAYSFAQEAYRWASDLARSVEPGDPNEDLFMSIIDGNYGAALVLIAGLEEKLAAFSSLSEEDELLKAAPPSYIVGLEPDRKFDVKNVNRENQESEVSNSGFFPRHHDSEAKILERINKDLGLIEADKHVLGYIYIYTDREPCISCEWVTEQFMNNFPNISITYYYNKSISANKRRRGVIDHDALPQ